MKTVMFTGERRAECVEVEDPAIGAPHEAIIAVERTAICGSDLHPYRGEWGDPTGQRPGHEFMGAIVEVGAEVASYRAGDRVLVSGAVGCGRCASCGQGLSSACPQMQVLGIPALTEYPGGQAEFVVVPHADTSLLPIADGMSDEAALLLTDNLATGWQGARRAGITEGDRVAVVGLGPVGMCAVMSARALGAWEVFALDPIPTRRDFAAELGAIPMESTPDAVAEVLDRTGGGVDAAVETAGRSASVAAAVEVTHAAGRISSVSVASEPYERTPKDLLAPTQRWVESVASPQRAWPQLLPALDSAAFSELDRIFSHRFDLTDAAAAYELFSEHPANCRKVLFAP
ncbi:zinc-dependent alcohol dehydrogenase [Candidatus Poriferisocius sp.]|uniref:zinc-dependent alcohol dehydrogenase n=1 Tax=Candidatus Poriferisocius sp. TaxID=3101276 RepID=UPI003B5C5E05